MPDPAAGSRGVGRRPCAGWARLNHPVAETREGLRSAQVSRCFIRLGQDLDAVVYIELVSVYRFLQLFPHPECHPQQTQHEGPGYRRRGTGLCPPAR